MVENAVLKNALYIIILELKFDAFIGLVLFCQQPQTQVY